MPTYDFRIVSTTEKPVNFCFSNARLYTEPQLAGFKFIIELDPEDLYFPCNHLSTAWKDLAAAVAEKRIPVFNPGNPKLSPPQIQR